MPRPAVFFDRDNTLIACDDYLGDPADVALMDGAADAIARARALGYAIVVFSNQSGVARGLFSEEDVRAVNARLDELLAAQDQTALIDRHEFCPYHPQATVEKYKRESERRKPGPGMILSAAEALDIDLSRSWVIGDAPRDIEAGAAAGCRTILFRDPGVSASPAAEEARDTRPNYLSMSLRDAIDHIEHGDKPAEESSPEATPLVEAQPIERRPPEVKSRASKLEATAGLILQELRRAHELPAHADFSVAKLLAGIAQVISVAMVFVAYLNRNDASFEGLLIFAVWVQCLTFTLLIMGRS